MSEPGVRPPSIPVSYRLALALSLAVLAHTLLLAGLSSPLKDTRELSHRLVFTLTAPASQASAANPQRTDTTQTIRHPDFTVAAPSPKVITSDSASSAVPEPESRPPTPAAQSRPQTVEVSGEASPPMRASADSARPAAAPSNATDAQEAIQRITNAPAEQDPYLILLATHLAEMLEQQRVPAISTLKESVTMALELRILANGALIRARVVESTGVPGIDDAAYRAALAASPYPRPEGENTDRFEVKLVFTPKRH